MPRSLAFVALQCCRGWQPNTRSSFPRTRRGGHWTAHHRRAGSHHRGRALLAQHSLELALAVASEPLLVVILGPTGSGKTALSLALAQRFQGEIVNCDSVAMYREFEIGTAKPSREERRMVPHHLLDFVEPTDYITAGEYARRAREVLLEIKSRNKLPIIVGGTGLYLRALVEGLFPGPPRSEELRERLRKRAEQRGSQYLHAILRRLDPDAAAKIHANDIPKLIRAIEVCLASRQKMTEMWKGGSEPLTGFAILRVGLNPDRNALYQRLNARAAQMFELGLVEETQGLIKKYGDQAWPLTSLGYKQAVQLLRGEITRATAIQVTQQAHRNYAKRQMTWFRREPEVVWLDDFGDKADVLSRAISLVGEKQNL